MLEIIIPGVPMAKQGDRVKTAWNKTVGKSYSIHYQPRKIKDEQKRIAQYAMGAMGLAVVDVLDCEIELEINFVFPWPKATSKIRMDKINDNFKSTKPDLDNLEKMLCDGLEGIVFVNDSRICFKHSRKTYGRKPQTIVYVHADGC